MYKIKEKEVLLENNIKVSILIPVKNEEKYIEESIDSIVNQTYNNLEVIIIDDGSTDKTLIKLRRYEKFDWIKIFPTQGIGKNAAFNLAFENSTGDYICYFAGDDILLPDSIESKLSEILKYEEKELLLLSKLQTLSEDKKHNGQILPKDKTKGNMTGGSLMFTRNLVENIFPLPLCLANEDLWSNLYCQIFDVKIVHLPKVTYKLRIHENNSYSNFKTYEQRSEAMHKREIAYGVFLEKYRDRLNKDKIEYLAKYNCLETLRYNKNILSIVFLKDIKIKDKIRAIFYASKILYIIRVQMSALFSGRL